MIRPIEAPGSGRPARRVVYVCPFIPQEWVEAHGFRPSRITPGNHGKSSPFLGSRAGLCPFVDHVLDEIAGTECGEPETAAVLFTTVCDQMRRASECLPRESSPPLFLMHIPATWILDSSQKLYRHELRRMGRFLTGLSGLSPSGQDLARIMALYDEKRSRLKALRGSCPDRSFAEALARFHSTGEVVINPENGWTSAPPDRRIPLALLGGPLTRQDRVIFDFIREAGGSVVLDGTETGERTLPRPFSSEALKTDPLAELADAYFGHIPDVFRRPNTGLYSWLEKTIIQRGIRGLILIRKVWCDLWHAEVPVLRDRLDIPLLDIDLDGETPVLRNKTRIQAFLEMWQ